MTLREDGAADAQEGGAGSQAPRRGAGSGGSQVEAGGEAAKGGEMVFELVPMLTQLRRDRQAPDLDQIAADKKQGSACRLTCLLAVAARASK